MTPGRHRLRRRPGPFQGSSCWLKSSAQEPGHSLPIPTGAPRCGKQAPRSGGAPRGLQATHSGRHAAGSAVLRSRLQLGRWTRLLVPFHFTSSKFVTPAGCVNRYTHETRANYPHGHLPFTRCVARVFLRQSPSSFFPDTRTECQPHSGIPRGPGERGPWRRGTLPTCLSPAPAGGAAAALPQAPEGLLRVERAASQRVHKTEGPRWSGKALTESRV